MNVAPFEVQPDPARRIPPVLPHVAEAGLQPQAAVLARQNVWRTDKRIPSDENLRLFLAYVSRRPRFFPQVANLPMIFHIDQEFLPSANVRERRDTPVLVSPDGDLISMRWTLCNDNQCQRCIQGAGGYTFQWRGPWTCQVVLNLDQNAERQHAEALSVWRNCLAAERPCPACMVMRRSASPRYGLGVFTART
jgi:hypothetical protein